MMLADKETAETAIPKLMDFIGDAAIAAHNAAFDGKLLKAELRRLGREFNAPILDTLSLSRKLLPELKSFKLKSVCKALSVSLKTPTAPSTTQPRRRTVWRRCSKSPRKSTGSPNSAT